MATTFEPKSRQFMQFEKGQGLELMTLMADALMVENPEIQIMQLWHRKDDNMWTVDFCYQNEKSLHKTGFDIELEVSRVGEDDD